MSKRSLLIAVCLLACGPFATAATLEEAGLLNGAEPGAMPAPIALGDQVEGPARIRTADGGLIILPAGSQVRMVMPPNVEGDAAAAEYFELVSGQVVADLSYTTELLVLPAMYFAGLHDTTSNVFVEVLSEGGRRTAFFRVNEDSPAGAVVSYGNTNVMLFTGQGISLTPQDETGALEFRTYQSNEGNVLYYVAGDDVEIELALPKATSGAVSRDGKFTRVESYAASWQGGRIGVKTRKADDIEAARERAAQSDGEYLAPLPTKEGVLGPGTFARINNETGDIQFGLGEVDFEIVERAVSLTSEFSVLAVSNFFGLK